jgi:solute carrier family 25 (mitochondrial carnitine/acylcarnitine transporter), member 20/29
LPDELPFLWRTWTAGAAAGFATFVVSAPTELIKCRAQVTSSPDISSWTIARDIWKREGVRGLYYGGAVTSIRDAVGYGFYFLAYEWSRQAVEKEHDTSRDTAFKVLLCGGFAGVVTWASIFPLDVIKTRVQTQTMTQSATGITSLHGVEDHVPLLRSKATQRMSTIEVAKQAYRTEGIGVFFRGLGVCSVRAFIVNAVQWAVYEWMMRLL